MTLFCAALLALLYGSGGAAAADDAGPSVCPLPDGPAERVEALGLDENGLLRLQDGRRIRLAGLDAGSLRTGPLSGDLTFRPTGLPDRHGFGAGDLRADGLPEGEASVALRLVRAGAARVRPRPGEGACFAALLTAEARARQAGLGLWADPRYAILDASDEAAVARWLGRYAIVQGRIRHVGTVRERIYLDFGRVWRTDVTATLAMRDLGRFRAAGIVPDRLEGRLVRLRGTPIEAGGPSLAISEPAALEVLDERAAAGLARP